MNYITSCPKCDTHFLLNDELIKAHRGKVQCGSCEHVFNAKNRLTEVADDITSADEYQASLEEQEELIDAPTVPITQPFEYDDVIDTATNSGSATDFNYNTSATDPIIEHSLNLEVAPDIAPDFEDFTKNLTPPEKTKKHTALFSVLSVMLIVAASLQTIYHLRVKIAAEHPQFKPLLVKACAPLNCTVDLPKELDFITIGDSDMQEDDSFKSVINFSSSLKNNADYAQAYPNILLTLTDANDQVAIKKLIAPKEYLPSEKNVEEGLAAQETNAIKLALYVNEATVAGYRILITY